MNWFRNESVGGGPVCFGDRCGRCQPSPHQIWLKNGLATSCCMSTAPRMHVATLLGVNKSCCVTLHRRPN